MRRLSLPLENAFGLMHHSSGTDITHRLLLPRRGFLGGNPARSKATRPINKRKWSRHQIQARLCPKLQPSLAPPRASRLSHVTGELAPTQLDPVTVTAWRSAARRGEGPSLLRTCGCSEGAPASGLQMARATRGPWTAREAGPCPAPGPRSPHTRTEARGIAPCFLGLLANICS